MFVTIEKWEESPYRANGEIIVVFVIGKNKQPLAPTTKAKARILLKEGKAVVHRAYLGARPANTTIV